MAEANDGRSGPPGETRAATLEGPAAQRGNRPALGQDFDAGGRPEPPEVAKAVPGRLRLAVTGRAAREVAVLAAYLAAGVAVTWPRTAYLRVASGGARQNRLTGAQQVIPAPHNHQAHTPAGTARIEVALCRLPV